MYHSITPDTLTNLSYPQFNIKMKHFTKYLYQKRKPTSYNTQTKE